MHRPVHKGDEPEPNHKQGACGPTERFLCGWLHGVMLYSLEQRFSEVSRLRDAECIGDAIEEGKHGCDVNSFRNLRLCPPMIAQDLHILRSGAVGGLSDLADIVQESTFRWIEVCFIQLALGDRLYCLFFCSLNPQEVSM